MTKTKKQLRAEAVERLDSMRLDTGSAVKRIATVLGVEWNPDNVPASVGALHNMLRYLLVDDELPEGDAPSEFAEILMSLAADCSCMGDGIVRHFEPKDVQNDVDALMRVVERDYVSREVYDSLKKLSTDSDAWLKRKVDELTAERDEWKAKAEQAMESYADVKDARDTWMSNYLQAERAMNKAAGKWARADAELRANDGITNLEWLMENDRDFVADWISKASYCRYCAFWDDCDGSMGSEDPKCIRGNREWLMAPHEEGNGISDNLRKSQDSEIESCGQDADQPKREEAPDCESDSREKLEADVLEIARKINMTEDGIKACAKELNALLDRQAAITESECLVKSVQGADAIAQAEIAELQDQLESAHAKNRALKAHISKIQEGRHGWHIKAGELQKKVDALTQANADYREEWHRVCRERDDLQRKLHESNRERERLRKSLGIAIDHAHDMIALVSVDTDEGLA